MQENESRPLGSETTEIAIKDVAEHDIRITLHSGEVITLQYRNYQLDGSSCDKGTFDILLDKSYAVFNWNGDALQPAPMAFSNEHCRLASQLCVVF